MKTAHFLRFDAKSSQDLSSGPLDFTTSFGRKFKLEQVMVHASQAISELITITLVSKHGPDYNLVIRKHDMDHEQDFLHRPDGQCNFQDGDEINVQCTNANEIGEVFLQIKTSEM